MTTDVHTEKSRTYIYARTPSGYTSVTIWTHENYALVGDWPFSRSLVKQQNLSGGSTLHRSPCSRPGSVRPSPKLHQRRIWTTSIAISMGRKTPKRQSTARQVSQAQQSLREQIREKEAELQQLDLESDMCESEMQCQNKAKRVTRVRTLNRKRARLVKSIAKLQQKLLDTINLWEGGATHLSQNIAVAPVPENPNHSPVEDTDPCTLYDLVHRVSSLEDEILCLQTSLDEGKPGPGMEHTAYARRHSNRQGRMTHLIEQRDAARKELDMLLRDPEVQQPGEAHGVSTPTTSNSRTRRDLSRSVLQEDLDITAVYGTRIATTTQDIRDLEREIQDLTHTTQPEQTFDQLWLAEEALTEAQRDLRQIHEDSREEMNNARTRRDQRRASPVGAEGGESQLLSDTETCESSNGSQALPATTDEDNSNAVPANPTIPHTLSTQETLDIALEERRMNILETGEGLLILHRRYSEMRGSEHEHTEHMRAPTLCEVRGNIPCARCGTPGHSHTTCPQERDSSVAAMEAHAQMLGLALLRASTQAASMSEDRVVRTYREHMMREVTN